MDYSNIILGYLFVVNAIGWLAMGLDKKKAKSQRWRIPEARLFLIALIGGSLGCWGGMYAFRHKTRHWYFVVGMPLILLLQIAAGILVYLRFFRG